MSFLPLLLALVATLDPHSQGNPHEVRPTHLALDLSLDFERQRITASAELELAYPGGRQASRLDLDDDAVVSRHRVRYVPDGGRAAVLLEDRSPEGMFS